MQEDLKQVKETILKLFELAEDEGAFEGEVRNALAHAERLMARHHLSRQDILSNRPGNDSFSREENFGGARNMATWEVMLASLVTNLTGANWYFESGNEARYVRGKHRACVYFYGLTEDARLAAEVFDCTHNIVTEKACLKYGGCYRGKGRVYSEAYVNAIRQKHDAQRTASASQSDSAKNALALHSQAIVHRKQELANEWLKDKYDLHIGTRTRSSHRMYCPDAWDEGTRDGEQHRMHTGKEGKLGQQRLLTAMGGE